MADKNGKGPRPPQVVSALRGSVDQSARAGQMELHIQKNVTRWMRRVARRVYPPAYVLGRVACLGQEVFGRLCRPAGRMLPRRSALLNMQKVRVDLLMEEIAAAGRERVNRAQAARVMGHLARKDVTWLIEQQQRLIWLEHRQPVAFCLMDSFAELTDQQFRHRREGWSFCCHYSDLNHTPEFEAEFECLGLLPVERIETAYRRFFEWFAGAHAGVKVYFVHFPAALDGRAAFKERAGVIREAIKSFGQEHAFIKPVVMADDDVKKAPGDDFAYHFAPETFERFAGLVEGAHGAH
ncbi:MAG TPA: hypothetical protein VGN88_14125 [Phycisphaerae bacterium]|jgi:hypothetical protein